MEKLNAILDIPLDDWLKTILAIGIILTIVALGEIIYMFFPNGKSYSRKFVHITVGIIIAFLPFYMPSQEMTVILGAFFIVANFVAFQLSLFKGMHHKRDSLGTVFFPITFTFLCLVSWSNPWHIAFPVLAMAIGDGMASIIGENVRKPRQLFSEIKGKSLQGSGTVFLTVLVLLTIYEFYILGHTINTSLVLAIIAGSMLAAIAEIVAWKGSDNFTLPIFVWVVMRLMDDELFLLVVLTFALVVVIAYISIRLRFLTQNGGLALILLGFFMFTVGGLAWSIPIVSFFIASSMLSKLPMDESRKKKKSEKGSRRDASQVFANGFIPAILLLIAWLTKNHIYYDIHIIALAGATADTWATEIGGRIGSPNPFHLRLFKHVPAGTSGAVSLMGFLGSFIGGVFISLIALPWTEVTWLIGGAAGLLIALFDSILGAYLQKQYICPNCSELLEKPHHCGQDIDEIPVNLYGLKFLNNNKVNLVSIVLGCLVLVPILI